MTTTKEAETTIENCDGYRRLLAAVVKDEGPDGTRQHHDYRGKLKWVLDRAHHYAEKTGLNTDDILDAWEKERSYWYMNYYQDCNQPQIVAEKVRVFETTDELVKSIGAAGFRCPRCAGVSKSPYACDSGFEIEGSVCDWKVYGLFRDLGQGVFVFVKGELRGETIFMPLAWE